MTTLTASGPVTVTANNQVIQNLVITAPPGQDGVDINGFTGVKVLNCVINHGEGGSGIFANNASGLIVQGCNITQTDSPATGADTSSDSNNIFVTNSSNILIGAPVSATTSAGTPTAAELALGNKVTNGSSGVYTINCPSPTVNILDGYNQRGPFPRGQLVQYDTSPNGSITNFSDHNDLAVAWTEDNINIYGSSNTKIAWGLLDGNNSPSGDGVIAENGSTGVTVDHVSVINWGNGGFGTADGASMVITNTFLGTWHANGGRGIALSANNGATAGLSYADNPTSTLTVGASNSYSPDSQGSFFGLRNNLMWDASEMPTHNPTATTAFTPPISLPPLFVATPTLPVSPPPPPVATPILPVSPPPPPVATPILPVSPPPPPVATPILPTGQVVLTPTSGGSFTDRSGNVWTLSSTGRAIENGSNVPGGGGTSELAYLASTGTVYGQDAASGHWFTFSGNNWHPSSTSPISTPVSPPPPPVSTPVQPSGEILLTRTSGGSFTDRSGNVWTLSSTGRAIENGSGVPGGGGTSELAYVASTQTVWGQDAASGRWYTFSGHNWRLSSTSPTGAAAAAATQTSSSGDVALTPGSGASLVDGPGNIWTLSSTGDAIENGSGVPGGGGTSQIVTSTGTVWGQDAASGNWFAFSGSNWNPSSTGPTAVSASVATSTAAQSQVAPTLASSSIASTAVLTAPTSASLPDLNMLFSHPDFTQTATTLGETGNSQPVSAPANDAVASTSATQLALLNQMMAVSLGNGSGQIATASAGPLQNQSLPLLAKALG